MEHLALGLVWLLGMLVSVSPMDKQVHIDEKALDMAPNSFDDQYQACRDDMEKELKELNRSEFDPNSNYGKAWKKATAKWQKISPESSDVTWEEAVALMAYTVQRPPLYKEFNAAVREAGRSPEEYLINFHFKVLHFLLTQAIRDLQYSQPRRCYKVYRGVKDIIFTAQRGQTVRFGYFASSSLNKMRAEKFGNDTFFTVKTCYGVPIGNYSFFHTEEEVLIPPFETFKVTRVTHRGNSAHIKLQSQDIYSKYNCEFLKGQSVSRNTLRAFILAATALATTVGI